MADRDDIPERIELGDALDVPLRQVAGERYVDFVPVGEGGMGIVYWALDNELKRQVAFKVIRPPTRRGKDGVTPPAPLKMRSPDGEDVETLEAFDEMRARFLQEAWVTGGMEHPGIVPVYELGETDGGVPYYTMKFVRGSTTLATAIDEAPTLDARLELLESFLKVCDTIRYAHSRGVVHRDIKPENIALGEFGEVVVLDWGLAKLEGVPDAGSRPQSRWQGNLRAFRDTTRLETDATAVGTPGYMSPEAAQGLVDDLDHRSDVYSLGAILYEILTGRLAFDFRTFGQYREQVTQGEPPDPLVVAPDAPPGLAAICRAAMARSRAERTASVDALAVAIRAWRTERRVDREMQSLLQEADARLAAAEGAQGDALLRTLDRAALACRRALELRPEDPEAKARAARVEAVRSEGLAARERAARGRLLRRVAAAVLVVGALSAAIVAGVLEQRRQEAEDARLAAARALERAEADRARAEGAMGFMVGEMQERLEPLGRLDLLASIGAEAKAYYEALGQLAPEERTPASLRNGAVALRNLGDVHRSQGQLPAAQAAYEMSLELARALAKSDADASTLHASLAQGRLGDVLTARGYASHAVEMLGRHVEETKSRSIGRPTDLELQAALAEAYAALSRAQLDLFEIDASLASAQAALDIAQALVERDDEEGTHHRALVRYMVAPSRAMRMRGRQTEFEARVLRALDLVKEWRGKRPEDARWHATQASVLVRAGISSEALEDIPAALLRYEQAREVIQALTERDPTNLRYAALLVFTLQRIGRCVLELELAKGAKQGEITAPGPYWRDAYERQKALVEKDPTNANWMRQMIDLCDRMAGVASVEGEPPLVIERYRTEALRYARKLMECDEANVLWKHLFAYTLFQHAQRRWDFDPTTSRKQIEESVALCKELAPVHKDAIAEIAVLHAWGVGRLLKGVDDATARRMDEEALALLEQAHAAVKNAGNDMTLLDVRLRQGLRLASGSAEDRKRARELYDAARRLEDAQAERWPDRTDIEAGRRARAGRFAKLKQMLEEDS